MSRVRQLYLSDNWAITMFHCVLFRGNSVGPLLLNDLFPRLFGGMWFMKIIFAVIYSYKYMLLPLN